MHLHEPLELPVVRFRVELSVEDGELLDDPLALCGGDLEGWSRVIGFVQVAAALESGHAGLLAAVDWRVVGRDGARKRVMVVGLAVAGWGRHVNCNADRFRSASEQTI